MQNRVNVGDSVSINTDNWEDIGMTGKVTDIQENKATVIDENGVVRTLSLNQITPQRFLSE